MLVWEGIRGVYGPGGIHVSILARLYSFCLGHIIKVNSQSTDAGNFVCLCQFCWICEASISYFIFNIVTAEFPSVWIPAFCLDSEFFLYVARSVSADSCSHQSERYHAH